MLQKSEERGYLSCNAVAEQLTVTFAKPSSMSLGIELEPLLLQSGKWTTDTLWRGLYVVSHPLEGKPSPKVR